ncbi:MAG: hypothetical protein RLZZ387_4212 [Chloroflexota bacterium]|jgi:CheY-like chemotaxis protein
MSGDNTGGQPRQVVLVVDDEESVRQILVRLLDHIGYATLTANDGVTAVDTVRSGTHVDGVLMDVAMPGISGVEAAQQINALAPHLPIILMSGHALPWLSKHGLAIPIAGFLQKPFTFENLRHLLHSVLPVT